MTPNIELESKVIKKFIDKTKQDRYIQFISKPKNRDKFTKALAHFRHFKWELFEEVKGIEEQVILTTLRNNKVDDKTCYIISESSRLDTRTMSTIEAISAPVGMSLGTILVFGDAEIIFYESETINTRYISKLVK